MNDRSEALAARLEAGAAALAAFAATLSEAEWRTRVPGDGRKIAAVVHHVASVYPIEIRLAHSLAAGPPITSVTSSLRIMRSATVTTTSPGSGLRSPVSA